MIDDKTFALLVGGIAVSVIVLKLYQNLTVLIVSTNWAKVAKIAVVFIISLAIVTMLTIGVVKKMREREERKRVHRMHIDGLKHELYARLNKEDWEWYTSQAMKKDVKETKAFVQKLPEEIKSQYEKSIEQYYRRMAGLIDRTWYKEIEENIRKEKKAKQEKKERAEYERQLQELIAFKRSHKSAKAMPIKKEYPDRVVAEAENKVSNGFRKQKEEQEETERMRKDALEYYKTHPLDTKPWIGRKMDTIYAQVRQGLQEGKITLHHEDYSGGKLKKNFYRAEGLRQDIKRRVLLQGFTFVNGVDLNGKPTAGFYIKKTMEKESDHHFIMKHLFGEINQQVKIEYTIEGKRVDAAHIYRGMKIGIEVETGTNKDAQLVEKVLWLNRHFDYWMFVCSRDLLPRYMHYVDNVKSFCLTPKKAKAKFRELIAAVKQR